MSKNRIEKSNTVLDEMESYLNSARCALFSSTQVIVDRIKMEEFLRELRQYINMEEN